MLTPAIKTEQFMPKATATKSRPATKALLKAVAAKNSKPNIVSKAPFPLIPKFALSMPPVAKQTAAHVPLRLSEALLLDL